MTAARKPDADQIACTYLGCTTIPTRRLEQSTGHRPWFGCDQHWPAMEKALAVGLPGALSGTAWVDVRPIREEDYA